MIKNNLVMYIKIKNYKSRFSLLLIFILFLAIVFMIYKNRKISNVLVSNINIANGLNSEIENLNKKAKIQIENNFFSLDKGIILINMKGDTFKLEDVISDKMLVFRYSMLNCGACIQKEFENINYTKFDKELQRKNIMFIAFYQEIRDLIVTYRSLKLDIPIYIISNNELGMPIEKNNIPFYFAINENLKVNYVFIPERDKNELTLQYLNSIKNYFK